MPLVRRCALFCAAVALASVPSRARAETSYTGTFSVALGYETVAGCPDAPVFKAVVSERLGYDPFRDDASARVLVQVTNLSRGIRGRLEWRDRAGNWVGDQDFAPRVDDCRELVRTMALAVAVQIQLLALEREAAGGAQVSPTPSADGPQRRRSAPSRAPPSAPALSGSPPETRAKSEIDPVASSSRLVFGAGVGASLGFGLSSGATPLARAFGKIDWRWLSVELSAEASIATTTRREDGGGYSQQLVAAGAAGCGNHQIWSACLLMKAGVVRVAGQNVDVPASASGALWQAGVRFAASPSLGRNAYFRVRADGLTTLARWTVTLDGVPVWTSPPFAGVLGIDVGFTFP